MMISRRRMLVLCVLLLAAGIMLCGCQSQKPQSVQIKIDGAAFGGGSINPDAGDDLRVYVTLDGEALMDLPFGMAHTVEIVQPGVGENTFTLTGESVYMLHADCENQDCVHMGEVTRDNLEFRVMGGFIICLPHRLSIEVRGE